MDRHKQRWLSRVFLNSDLPMKYEIILIKRWKNFKLGFKDKFHGNPEVRTCILRYRNHDFIKTASYSKIWAICYALKSKMKGIYLNLRFGNPGTTIEEALRQMLTMAGGQIFANLNLVGNGQTIELRLEFTSEKIAHSSSYLQEPIYFESWQSKRKTKNVGSQRYLILLRIWNWPKLDRRLTLIFLGQTKCERLASWGLLNMDRGVIFP